MLKFLKQLFKRKPTVSIFGGRKRILLSEYEAKRFVTARTETTCTTLCKTVYHINCFDEIFKAEMSGRLFDTDFFIEKRLVVGPFPEIKKQN